MPDEQFRSDPWPAGGGWAERPPVPPSTAGRTDWPGQPAFRPLKHSELGFFSSALAILSIVLCVGYWGLIVTALGLAAQNRMPPPKDSPVPMIAGLMGIGAGLVALVGTILGIVGVTVGNRKKLFAWIGLGLNGALLLGCAGVFCLGLASIFMRAGAR
jgi:hypothetical protein